MRRERSVTAAVALLALACAPLLLPSTAEAAEVRAESAARRVAVGQTFTVEVTAILDDGDVKAQSPTLPVQGDAEVRGPSLFTQRRVVMHNFDVKTEKNVVATYEITPTKPGRLVLGPGAFVVDGRRLEAEALTVEVVEGPAQSARPGRSSRQSPFSFDPFAQDPFGRDPSGRQGQDPDDQDPFDLLRRRSGLSAYPEAPAELELESAPNKVGFLVARVNQPTAVVGEPIVLSIYAYGGRGAFRELSPTEPALPDFLSYPSVQTSHEQPFYRTEIQGQEFLVVKLRELVLVPLRTGKLELGSMRAVLRGRGYPSQGSPLGSAATSPPLHLAVREPPLADRPPGYRLGDVGRFELSAEVDPRELEQNGFFTVRFDLRGRGNLPASLEMPEIPGIVWGPPTVRGEVGVEDRDLVGERKIEFTARATSPGTIDLGTISLPHFDPETERYRIASAPLGSVTVAPGAAPPPNAQATPTTLEAPGKNALLAALAPRKEKVSWSPTRNVPPAWALALAAVAPGIVWLLTWLPALFAGLAQRVQKGRSRRRSTDFSALRTLERTAGRARAASELEQLLYRLIEEKTGLKARAILKEHLALKVEQAGLDATLAGELQSLLLALDAARFLSSSGAEGEASLVDRAEPVLERLSKVRSAQEKTS